jgi:hypothetical protein
MTRRRLAAGLALMAAFAQSPALGNGEVQREIHGRVVAVDPPAGTLVVAREFRGKTARVGLRAGPRLTVFACGDEQTALDRVKRGMVVSVFYEALGAEGVVNLVVVEPTR